MSESYDVKAVLSAEDKNFSSTLNSISSVGAAKFGALSTLGSKAMNTLVSGVKKFATESISTGMSFESSMSQVAAISGATGSDLELLESTARQMGSTTVFSASEAADALQYMSLAGWDAQKSAAELPGVLNLAAASGMGLAEASDMVTDYLSAFSNSAMEATEFADMLAYAQSNSNTTAAQLGQAYKNCAANLNAAGQDVQTVTSCLEAMANQGLKGSEAGTALNAMMRDITSSMEDGAIAIGETSVKVTDAEGNYRDLTDILKDVETATNGMGDAERAAALSATFTSDSTKGLNLLLNEGIDNIAGYEDELRSCSGTAEKMAGVMNDNLSGDLKTLNSAWEELQLQLYDFVAPALREVVQTVTTYVIPAISELISWLGSLKLDEFFANFDPKPLIAVAGAAGTALVAFKAFSFLKSFNPFSVFASKGKTSVSSIGSAVGNVFQKTLKGAGQMVSEIEKGFGTMTKSVMTGFSSMMTKLGKLSFTQVASGLTATAGAVAIVVAALLVLAACQDTVLPFLQGLADIIISVVNGALQSFADFLITLSPILVTIGEAFAALSPLVTALGEAFAEVVSAVGEAASSIITAITPIVSIITQAFTTIVSTIASAIVSIVEALAPYAPELTAMVEATTSMVSSVADSFASMLAQVSPIIDSLSGLVAALGDSISEIFDSAGGVIESFGSAVNSILSGVADIIDSIGEACLNAGKGFDTLADGVAKITGLNLLDMAASLTAVATGVGAISLAAIGLGDAGTQIQSLAQGLVLLANNINGVTTAAASIPNVVASFASLSATTAALSGAGAIFTALAAAIAVFAAAAVTAGASASSLTSGISAMSATLSKVSSSATTATSGLKSVSNSANSTASAFSSSASKITASMSKIGSSANSMGSNFSSIASRIKNAFSSMVSSASSSLNSLTSKMNSTANSAKTAGTNTGTNYTNGLSTGLSNVTSVANTAGNSILNAWSGLSSKAYTTGYYIGIGLANGMSSSLSRVQSVAAQLATAAAQATAAAAKVKSPSRVFMEIGDYFGQGLAKGIDGTQKLVTKASEAMVAIPEAAFSSIEGMSFAGMGAIGYDTSIGGEYDYSFEFNIDLPIDGKTFAQKTVKFMASELTKNENRSNRKGGTK